MNRKGFSAVLLLVVIGMILVAGGIWYYGGQQSQSVQPGSQIQQVIQQETQQPTSTIQSSTSTFHNPTTTTSTATKNQNTEISGWNSARVAFSQSPDACYTIQYPPELTPQSQTPSSPTDELLIDKAMGIANGLQGVEIRAVANETAETAYQNNFAYGMGTAQVKDFSTTSGLSGKELLVGQSGNWTVYLNFPAGGENFVLIVGPPSTQNLYSLTTAEEIAASIKSCSN